MAEVTIVRVRDLFQEIVQLRQALIAAQVEQDRQQAHIAELAAALGAVPSSLLELPQYRQPVLDEYVKLGSRSASLDQIVWAVRVIRDDLQTRAAAGESCW